MGCFFRFSPFIVYGYHSLGSPLLNPAGSQLLQAWVPQQGVGHQPAVAGLPILLVRVIIGP